MSKKYVLLVGVSEYELGLRPLPGSLLDVDAMRRVLTHPELGGVAETDITVLKNPVRQEMEDAIYELFSDRKKDDLLLFYFSGHGIKDENGKLYLAARSTRKDSNGKLVKPSAVPATALHENFDESRSQRQVIILDCCFSGAIAQGMTVKDDGTVNLKHYLGGKGRAILTSSSATEYSFSPEIVGHEDSGLSVYTRYLVEGIEKGAADADGDGWIAVEELHEYAANRVKEAAPSMTPKFYPVEEGYKIILARSPQDDPRLKYRKELQSKAEQGQGKLSSIAEQYLEDKRIEWGISAEEAKAIKEEVLQPYREYEHKLQKYEQELIKVAQAGYPLSELADTELKEYQQHLGLRDSDITAIEARILEPLKRQFIQQSEDYQQKLIRYEQEFRRAIDAEYPLSEYTIRGLQDFQQSLGLNNEDVERAERPIRVQREAKHRQIQELEQQRIKEEQERLKREQEKLEYQRNLQRYEQEFRRAIEAEYPLSEHVRNGLKNFQQSLGLKNEDVERVENPIYTQKESEYRHRQEADQQKKLREEQERLKREQEKLEYQRNLQRYEKEFRRAISAEYPLSEYAIKGLRDFQNLLELKIKDIEGIESPIRVQKEAELKQSQEAEQQKLKEKQIRQERLSQEAKAQQQTSEEIEDKQKEKDTEIEDREKRSGKFFKSVSLKKKIIIFLVSFLCLNQAYSYFRYKTFPQLNPFFVLTSLPSSQYLDKVLTGHSGVVTKVTFSPNGAYLASAGLDASVRIWEVSTGKMVHELKGHIGAVGSISFSPDGKHLTSVGLGDGIKIWDVPTGKEIRAFPVDLSAWVWPVLSFSSVGDYLAFSNYDDEATVVILDALTGQQVAVIKLHAMAYAVQFSPDGKSLATGGGGGVIEVWELSTQQKSLTLEAPSTVSLLAFNPDGEHLFARTTDDGIKSWNISTGNSLLGYPSNHFGSTRDLTISPDGNQLATSGFGSVKIREVATGKETLNLLGHSFGVESIAFSPDGKYLASGGEDKTIKIWKLQ